MRSVVEAAFGADDLVWGGSPFISTYIFDTTQSDLRVLTPFAVLVIVGIVLASFRDVVGSWLALFTTSLGILASRAAMGLLDVSFNIVLSSMPVILFAVGSAYSIHMLSRYYALALVERDEVEALRRTMVETAPVVVAAGLTTVVGLLSFLAMDIAPMRTFGVFTALGIFTVLVLSITFVPSVIRVAGLKGRRLGKGGMWRAVTSVSASAQGNPVAVGAVLLISAVIGTAYIGQVDNRMDQSTFFSEGSPPDRAQKLLDNHFGGSQFLQIHLRGDFSDPHVLRELRFLSDRVSLLPDVTQVTHIADIVALLNEAMDGVRALPPRSDQVGILYSFLAGRPAVRQLVSDARDEALVQVKIGSNNADILERVLEDVEALAATVPSSWRTVQAADELAAARRTAHGTARLRSLARSYGVAIAGTGSDIASALLKDPGPPDGAVVRDGLVRFLVSPECFVELSEEQAGAVADATLPLGPTPDTDPWSVALTEALEPLVDPGADLAMMVDDIVVSTEAPLVSLFERAVAMSHGRAMAANLGARLPDDERAERFLQALADALVELDAPEMLVPGEGGGTLDVQLTGLPVMYAGLSRSVTTNQFRSLAGALVLVLVIMTVLFRSPVAGLVATVPTVLTLLWVYGTMGARGVHLDIGTSMIGSIIIGAGVDYAVHLMAGWKGRDRVEALRHATDATAHAVWTNALMVALGFYVLTLGEARPLQNVGSLVSAAMLAAAVATFVAIPVLARAARYR